MARKLVLLAVVVHTAGGSDDCLSERANGVDRGRVLLRATRHGSSHLYTVIQLRLCLMVGRLYKSAHLPLCLYIICSLDEPFKAFFCGHSLDSSALKNSTMIIPRPAAFAALTLFFGLGLAQTDTTASTTSTSTAAASATTDATSTVTASATTVTQALNQMTLSSDFVITNVPATRTYDWTVSTMTGSPDGYYRPMLVVNGKRNHICALSFSTHSLSRTVSWSDD
jgi:hypothetical protein